LEAVHQPYGVRCMRPPPLTAEQLALKAFTRSLIDKLGGLDAAATCCRVGRSQLANYCSPHHDQFLPIDILQRLELVAEDASLTEELLRPHGLVATRPQGSAATSLLAGLALLAAEMSDLHRVSAEGMEDGQLCRDDKLRIERELQDVIRQASGLMADLHVRLARAASPLPGRP